MTPKVTVLLAVHDGEPYVRQAVASVLAQTFPDFELLIVDDASSDLTVAIVESFADSRVRLLRNEHNLGQVPSLNRGLLEARGEYVARLDADDWCRPTRLERQVAVLDSEPRVGLVGTWLEAVGERGQRLGWLRKTLDDYVDFVYHTLIMRVYISHPSAMYRREPVLALGSYDETTAPAEDKDLWRKLALSGWHARIVPEPLVVYRLHEGQLSQTRAAYQREVDGLSQERFLAELSPGGPVHGLRLLLANDSRVWLEPAPPTGGDLDGLISGTAERLSLDHRAAARLEELVARRVLEVAGTRPWRRAARSLAADAVQRLPAERRRNARAAYACSFGVTPVRLVVRRGARFAADGARHVPGLRRLHAPAKRLRAARLLYGKLIGSS